MLKNCAELQKIASTKVDAKNVELKTLADYQNYIDQATLNRVDISKDPKLDRYYQYLSTLTPERKKEVINYARGRGYSGGATQPNTGSGYWDRVFKGVGASAPNRKDEDAHFSAFDSGVRLMEPKVWEAEQGAKGTKSTARRLRNMEQRMNRIKQFNDNNWFTNYWMLGKDNQANVEGGRRVRATWNPFTWLPAFKGYWGEFSPYFSGE